ncbi:PLD nuclease N-terminal domain-containing protein [Arthrobacter sulfonylureivorans]|uniref:PLD nuclease N-terminal domain-containing protein n=1 Tax=Arthrobacter sulfonylureivorans TaxID=2486855 RepID=A0ABY3W911_9MICC|nr:PLD nuclease N-terminal domain-containing protein [Arthrobacter sulfonylureivorans]UNK46842.1 PLD nuclease N-terminal domain-containing protein [Arthrobacter sulfonylureivorans]
MGLWEDFWEFFWFLFWTVAFIAYLITLFSVVADLFRDRSLNGWWKAVWIVFLIFLPFLTVLVYLIARGTGMAERSQQRALNTQDAVNKYIGDVAGTSPSDEIAKAKSLLDTGNITADEYAAIKSHALHGLRVP